MKVSENRLTIIIIRILQSSYLAKAIRCSMTVVVYFHFNFTIKNKINKLHTPFPILQLLVMTDMETVTYMNVYMQMPYSTCCPLSSPILSCHFYSIVV